MNKRSIVYLMVLVVFAGILLLLAYMKLPYNISSRGLIMPVKEWSLKRSTDGTLISMYKDYERNLTTHFSVTEFQRGDLVEFIINKDLVPDKLIHIGDTIGIIRSMEEERRLVELMAELQVQKSLLRVHSTGEKPESVKMAYEAIIKAEHEYKTQKKVTERNEILFNDDVIPEEEYELSLNEYLVKKQNLSIAQSNYEAVSTGAKPEQLDFINASIRSLELQIENSNERLQSFNLISPINGILMGRRGTQNNEETVVNIADLSQFIVVLPIEFFQVPHIKTGQEVSLKMDSYGISISAEIVGINNVVQMVEQRQNVFVTARINDDRHDIIAGGIADATVRCGLIPASEYFKRLFRIVYAH
jgi:hypothetical protein